MSVRVRLETFYKMERQKLISKTIDILRAISYASFIIAVLSLLVFLIQVLLGFPGFFSSIMLFFLFLLIFMLSGITSEVIYQFDSWKKTKGEKNDKS